MSGGHTFTSGIMTSTQHKIDDTNQNKIICRYHFDYYKHQLCHRFHFSFSLLIHCDVRSTVDYILTWIG